MAKSAARKKKAKPGKAKSAARAKSMSKSKLTMKRAKPVRKVAQSDMPDNMLSILCALMALKTGGEVERLAQSDVPDNLLSLLAALAAIHRMAELTQSDVPDNRLALLAALHAAYPGAEFSPEDPEFAALGTALDNAVEALPETPDAFRDMAKIAQSDVPDNMLALLAALRALSE